MMAYHGVYILHMHTVPVKGLDKLSDLMLLLSDSLLKTIYFNYEIKHIALGN